MQATTALVGSTCLGKTPFRKVSGDTKYHPGERQAPCQVSWATKTLIMQTLGREAKKTGWVYRTFFR